MSARFAIEPLSRAHKRTEFTSGDVRTDGYFPCDGLAGRKAEYATCFVARELKTSRVAGFCTLSSSNVPLNEVPEALAKKLPRYPTVPAVLIGWLGRHSDYAGIGRGEALLFDAVKTVATAPIGAHAIFVAAS
ncbi:MAG TPA: GNAT family N-acetyltransferase [Rhizobium sp.]